MSAAISEDVGEALEEDEGEDEVLELGGVDGAAADAGGVPEPGFQGRNVEGAGLGHGCLMNNGSGERLGRWGAGCASCKAH